MVCCGGCLAGILTTYEEMGESALLSASAWILARILDGLGRPSYKWATQLFMLGDDNVRTSVSLGGIGAWLDGGLDTPELVLGPREIEHNGRRALSVRAFLPDSRQAWVIDGSHGAAETSRPMRRIHPAGLYEAICPLARNLPTKPYRIRALDEGGEMKTLARSHTTLSRCSPTSTCTCSAKGSCSARYEKFGAHLREIDGVRRRELRRLGARTPRAVSVVGDFNHWDGRRHPMRLHTTGGVWELFIPGLEAGEKYKFRVSRRNGESTSTSATPTASPPNCRRGPRIDRLRPVALTPGTTATGWTAARTPTSSSSRSRVYEVHLGSWRRDARAASRLAELPRPGPPACRVLPGDGLHAL